MKFSDLGLSQDVLRAVADAGYEEPTPIQEQAIPYILSGRDILGSAQTGTGKTASFTLPMIDILAAGRAKARMPRSLILEPTRELATQVDENFAVYGKYHKLTTALLIGGAALGDQLRKLDRGVDVLIATPGRLLDIFERGKILLSDVKILVIDEADRMLDMGFIPDVERIVSLLPTIRQTLFFSATLPPEIQRLADQFLLNPKRISVSPPTLPAETVDHRLIVVGSDDKRQALRQLLRTEDITSALIFCNRKRDVRILCSALKRHGFDAVELHGDMPQPARIEALEAFKRGDNGLLVASDVAARGLDIEELPCVINFDVPQHPEDYIHRIGRTGRAGRAGRAFTLATPPDRKYVAAIARLIGREIPAVQLPGFESADAGADSKQAGDRASRRKKASGGSRRRQRRARPAQDKPSDGREQQKKRRTASEAKGARRRGKKKKADQSPTSEPTREKPAGRDEHLPAFLLRPVRKRS